MRTAGSAVTGFANRTSRPLPAPPDGPRPASLVHERRTRATGLNFDALAPACGMCGQKSPLVDCETGCCPSCKPVTRASRPAATIPAPAPTPRRRRRPQFDTDQAVRLYRNGMSLRDVAKKVGVSAPTVRKAIVGAGVELRPSGAQAAARSREPWPDQDEFDHSDPTDEDELDGGHWVTRAGVAHWVEDER